MRFHILRIFAFADDCCLKQGTVWKKKLELHVVLQRETSNG